MRVVQAAGWYFPTSSGGTEVYVSELARRLGAAGHEVMVAAPDALTSHERTYDHDGVPVYRYPIPQPVTRDEAQGRVITRGAERFHEWLRRVRPDVVHFHTYVTGLGVAELRAAKANGAQIIATTHSGSLGFTCQRGTMMRWGTRLCSGRVNRTICAACELQHRGAPRPLAWLGGMVPSVVGSAGRLMPGGAGSFLGMTNLIAHNQASQREMFELVDRFVVLTEWARQVVIDNGAPSDRVVLNRLGVRFPAAGPTDTVRNPGSEALTVAYIGRFDPIKGVEDLARAIGSLPRSTPIHFLFHGPVRNRADLAVVTRIKALVQGGWVTFGAELDGEGLQAVLGRIDVLCSPSRVLEGGPTIALEANARGVPVIGTDIPGLSEIVQDGTTGRLVPVGNWRALESALAEVAADRTIVDRWRAALGPVRTMDEVTEQYLGMYRAQAGKAL